MSRCPNCSAERPQEYCWNCGQRRIRPDDLSARRFFGELFDEVANLETKFKTVRTLRRLAIPGCLTAEYLRGRRQRYLTPFKVYLVCAAIFFLSAPLAGFKLASLIESDRSGTVGRLASARVADNDPQRPLFNARFDARVQSVYTVAVGIEAIFLAVMLQLLFRKLHWSYGAHLVFALHFVAFMYLLTIGSGALHRFGTSADFAAAVGYVFLVPYLVIALKRVYAESVGLHSSEDRRIDVSPDIAQRPREFHRNPTHTRGCVMDAQDRTSVLCFLVLTFGISSLFWIRSFGGAPLGSVVPFLMWTPGLCAIVTQLVFHRPIGSLGWRPGPLRYLALSIVLPLIYCAAIYVPVWGLGAGRFDTTFLARAFPLLPLAFVQNVFFALGEEIGWRGFLVPALYRLRGFAWAGVASGLIWGIWHVPLIIVGGYNAGTPSWYAVTCFMISVTAMSMIVAWLRLRSSSLWTAAFYHGAHNLTIQGIFDRSTIDTGWTKWITTEFGIGLTFATVVMSLYFWTRRGELSGREAARHVRQRHVSMNSG